MTLNHTLIAVLAAAALAACGDKAAPTANAPAPAAAPAPVTYEATLAEGIDFKKVGYPKFITEVTGMSGYEAWGRWTDADAGGAVARFVFKDKLPASLTLTVTANAFGPNDGKPVKVKAGGVEQQFTIKNGSEPGSYTVKFDKVDGNTIEFIPPEPTSPKSLGVSEDGRRLGIGFVALKIQ